MTGDLKHLYGHSVTVIQRPLWLSELATLCHPDTKAPALFSLVKSLYLKLIDEVIDREFRFKQETTLLTRMSSEHPDCPLSAPVLEPDQSVVVLGLARAGTLPAQLIFERLHELLPANQLRQDHFFVARNPDTKESSSSTVFAEKRGGSVEGKTLLIPDPMGATGGTLIEALRKYQPLETIERVVALHLIVTPEYLKKVTQFHPKIKIYCLRVDRGLSPQAVLNAEPGAFWEQERGLNSHAYIVPGGGGFGEILNNVYV